MTLKLLAQITILSLFTLPANAHDFWIEPDEYEASESQIILLRPMIGHGATSSPWPLATTRIVGLRSLSEDGLRDQQAAIPSVAPQGSIPLDLKPIGRHVVFLESANSYSELSAEKFNAYVEEEGIISIQEHRQKHGLEQEPGKELYSRRGKTIISVGRSEGSSEFVTKPIGLTLEVTPMSDPFDLDPGEPLQLGVTYRGEPLADATVHVTQLSSPNFTQMLRTNASGQASMDAIQKGTWLFHTVWSEPAEGLLQDADYLTVFSSLTLQLN